MDQLLAGYKRFRGRGWPQQRQRFETLAKEGQRPRALVLSCVDSRVDPAMVFDTAIGEILTVRNVANLAPPYAPDAAYHGTSAALEFGVRVLEVSDLVVLGHGLCGGVTAMLENRAAKTDFIGPWMSIARDARDKAMTRDNPAERQQVGEHEVVKVSLANLARYPWIAERVASGKLRLHGAWFSIYSGELTLLQPDGEFAPA